MCVFVKGIVVQQLGDYFMVKGDLKSEYCACLCNICIVTELIRPLSAVQLELLPDKGATDQ